MDNVSTMADQSSGLLKSNTKDMMIFSQRWVTGCRNISDIMTTASKAHFNHMITTMKAMSDVRTIKDAMELQMAATLNSIEQVVTNTRKLSAASMEMAVVSSGSSASSHADTRFINPVTPTLRPIAQG